LQRENKNEDLIELQKGFRIEHLKNGEQRRKHLYPIKPNCTLAYARIFIFKNVNYIAQKEAENYNKRRFFDWV
jgi:hypothetical protein